MPEKNAGTRLSLGASPRLAPALLRSSFELARCDLVEALEGAEPGDVVAALACPRSGEVQVARLRPTVDTPASLVIGRHEQAGLRLSRDPSLALRHALLVASVELTGGTLVRLFDLRTGQGLLGYDMERHGSFLGVRPACAVLGQTALYVVPAGPESLERCAFGDLGWADAQEFVPELDLLEPALPGHAPSDHLAARLQLEPAGREPLQLELSATRLRRGVLIGRYERCDGRPSDLCQQDDVSRVHALLVSLEGQPWLFDLASTNGIETVDGELVGLVPLSTTAPSRFRLATLGLEFCPLPKVRG